jgi:enoyl-[acyl-carrier protein] reductase II
MMVKEQNKNPVIAAGGIATGGMLAAMALGADGVQVGSRFAAMESSAHDNFKKRY